MDNTGVDYPALAGREHVFPDGIIIRIVQVKMREAGYWVTYENVYANALPKRSTMPAHTFMDTFGHLFPPAQ